jgi:hypothetical protein
MGSSVSRFLSGAKQSRYSRPSPLFSEPNFEVDDRLGAVEFGNLRLDSELVSGLQLSVELVEHGCLQAIAIADATTGLWLWGAVGVQVKTPRRLKWYVRWMNFGTGVLGRRYGKETRTNNNYGWSSFLRDALWRGDEVYNGGCGLGWIAGGIGGRYGGWSRCVVLLVHVGLASMIFLIFGRGLR